MVSKPCCFRKNSLIALIVAALLSILIVIDSYIISHQREVMTENLLDSTNREIDFLAESIKEPLHNNDYVMIEQFVNKWGKVSKNINKARLITLDKSILAFYQSKNLLVDKTKLYPVTRLIKSSPSDQFKLEVLVDLSYVDSNLAKLNWQLIISSIIVAFILGIVLWYLFKRFALVPLTGEKISCRQAEKLLKESKERFRTVADFTYDWEYWIGTENQIRYMSPSCERITGYSIKEFVNDPLLIEKIIKPEDRESCEDHFSGELKDLPPSEIEFRIINKSGGERWIGHSCQMVYGDHGQLRGRRVGNRDITELKNIQKKFEKSKNLAEKATQAKSDFISFISHELRTPLNAILGFSQLLDQLESVSKKKQKEFLGYILQSGNILLKLINDFTDLSKIESGKIDLAIEDVLVNKTIRDCLDMTSNFAQERSISLINNQNDSCQSYVVKADLVRFKQILNNLITNAIKYNKDKGTVTITTEMRENQMLRINVMDTGKGIKEQEMKKVFEPFVRLDQNPAGVEGTGVGLTISKQLIKLMKGAIGVKLNSEGGCIFWIELPVSQNQITSSSTSYGTYTGS